MTDKAKALLIIMVLSMAFIAMLTINGFTTTERDELIEENSTLRMLVKIRDVELNRKTIELSEYITFAHDASVRTLKVVKRLNHANNKMEDKDFCFVIINEVEADLNRLKTSTLDDVESHVN